MASHLVVGAKDVQEHAHPDNERNSLMQTSSAVRVEPKGELEKIQLSLEKSGHKRQRAGLLAKRLQSEPLLSSRMDLDTLLAMLLVYRDDNYPDMDEGVPHEPVEFVDTPPAGVGVVHGTSAITPRTRSRSPGTSSASKTNHIPRLQEEARRYRDWEDWVMQQEMVHPPPVPGRELVLDVGARIHNVMHHVSLPLPTTDIVDVDICMRIRRPNASGAAQPDAAEDTEEANLLQRPVPNGLGKIAGALQLLIPEARREVAWRLVQCLQDRMRVVLRRLLRQMDSLDGAQVLYSNHEGMLVGEQVDIVEINRVVDNLLNVLDREEDAMYIEGTEEDLPGLVRRLQRLLPGTESDMDVRRRRTASSSNTRAPINPSTVLDMANFMRDQIRHASFQHPETHHKILRQTTVVLTERMQMMATQLHVLVLVISDLLPQPRTALPETSASRAFGAAFARDLPDDLTIRFTCDGNAVVQAEPFGVTELLPLLTSLNPMIGELMSFLEESERQFSSSHEDIRMNCTVSDRIHLPGR